MEKFKIELFERDNPLKNFPWFHSLNAQEQKTIARNLSEKLGLGIQEDQSIIAKTIMEKGIPVNGFNAEDENFELLQVLSAFGIKPEKNVFIDWWFKYGEIDEMRFVDLNQCFDDIWFHGPDDIDIFDSTFTWRYCQDFSVNSIRGFILKGLRGFLLCRQPLLFRS